MFEFCIVTISSRFVVGPRLYYWGSKVLENLPYEKSAPSSPCRLGLSPTVVGDARQEKKPQAGNQNGGLANAQPRAQPLLVVA
jgi:hypothetical protein